MNVDTDEQTRFSAHNTLRRQVQSVLDSHASGQRPYPFKRRFWQASCWLVTVFAGFLASLMPDTMESVYGQHVYPSLVGVLSWVSALIPISLSEWLVVLTALALIWKAGAGFVRALAGHTGLFACCGRGVLNLLALTGVLSLIFLFVWGFNATRPGVSERSGLAPHASAAASVLELEQLSEGLVRDLNDMALSVRRTSAGDMVLRGSLGDLLEQAANAYSGHHLPAYAGLPRLKRAPKAVTLSPLMSIAGIAGIYIPFTGEAHINTDIPEPWLPFFACHELAHLQGVVHEGEANYLAWVACRHHASPEFRYSGTLVALAWVRAALMKSSPHIADPLLSLDIQVQRDMLAMKRWTDYWHPKEGVKGVISGSVKNVTQATNDTYLRAQGQSGLASYGEFVSLLIAEARMLDQK